MYFLEVDVEEELPIRRGLIKIKGIGKSQAKKICENQFIGEKTKWIDLSEKEMQKLSSEVSSYLIQNELNKKVLEDIQFKIKLGILQGIRHTNLLPVRGQRTRCNAKTQKKIGMKRLKYIKMNEN